MEVIFKHYNQNNRKHWGEEAYNYNYNDNKSRSEDI